MTLEKIIKEQLSAKGSNTENFASLQNVILQKISTLEKRRFYFKAAFWSGLSFFALGGTAFGAWSFYSEFISSGAKELFIIAFTDTGEMLANSSSFIYSLAESLPVGSLAVCFTAVAALLFTLQHLTKLLASRINNKIIWN